MTAPPHARVTMRDDSLPHQIRLTFRAGGGTTRIAVSCTCRAWGSNAAGPVYRPLVERTQWDDPDEPLRIWSAHMAEEVAS